MAYTVGEMANIMGVPASTLGYYDKEGLLPFVERTSGGIRMFKEQDYEWMKIIECMKRAGMPIKDIRDYIELALEGDATIHERLQLFQNQKRLVQEQMKSLQHTLDVLDYKCWYYETAESAGTTDVLKNISEDKIPDKYREIRKELSGVPGAES
ncbi:MAG: MerR family transcriptional regulator [Lachnospiraceae bacterium]|nr:MerR family transcriptional regulator [Lachnospiraceae bacterium]